MYAASSTSGGRRRGGGSSSHPKHRHHQPTIGEKIKLLITRKKVEDIHPVNEGRN